MRDRIIGALELCSRLEEMLLIQNKRVDWDTQAARQARAGRVRARDRRRRLRGQFQDEVGVVAAHR